MREQETQREGGERRHADITPNLSHKAHAMSMSTTIPSLIRSIHPHLENGREREKGIGNEEEETEGKGEEAVVI